MADRTGLRAWAHRHSELLDLGAGVAVALAVLGMSLIQWGLTDAGWTRGVTLGRDSGSLGHTGALFGFTTVALCFPNQGIVAVVLANAEHDVDTVAGRLVQAAST